MIMCRRGVFPLGFRPIGGIGKTFKVPRMPKPTSHEMLTRWRDARRPCRARRQLIYKSPATTAAEPQQRTTAAVGHTRPGSAWQYARVVGLTLEPSVLVLNLLCFSWFSGGILIFGKILKTKKTAPDTLPTTDILEAGATNTTAVRNLLRQSFSVPSSLRGWALQCRLHHVLRARPKRCCGQTNYAYW